MRTGSMDQCRLYSPDAIAVSNGNIYIGYSTDRTTHLLKIPYGKLVILLST